MRINLDLNNTEALGTTKSSSNGSATNPAGGTNASTQPSLGNDHAELSMDHARVAALAMQVSSLPEIRQEKVNALSDALQNGEYKVSPEQTAAAMLSEFLGNVA
jgi:flagellar biosynthesis anti-sigma factor FlgM